MTIIVSPGHREKRFFKKCQCGAKVEFDSWHELHETTEILSCDSCNPIPTEEEPEHSTELEDYIKSLEEQDRASL